VLDGRADAGAIGSPFWKAVRSERLVPDGALSEIWTSPPYNHCMFTARPDLDPSVAQRFAEALTRMSYDNPRHRAVLDAEGLRTHLSLSKDAPVSRAAQTVGSIIAQPLLGGLHHQYVRI
jgi:ABC-type phosphate/phosphonate transport system substrate-binding protein